MTIVIAFVGLICAVALCAFIAYVNVWYRRERAGLTTQQRAGWDAEERREAAIW